METELAAAKEEQRNLAETANVSGLGKEEIVKRAFELRDQAVKRKNQVEIELAKTRIEIMQINSQLMESIQQKVELSQQLEQWQVRLTLLNLLIWSSYSRLLVKPYGHLMGKHLMANHPMVLDGLKEELRQLDQSSLNSNLGFSRLRRLHPALITITSRQFAL